MAAKKKAAASRAAKTAPEDQGAASGPNALTGALYHGGRMYDHRKKKDQQDFARLVEKGGLAPAGITDKAERKKAHDEELQRLADGGALKGYGTKASAKKKSGDGEDTGVSTETLSEEEIRERTGAGSEGTGEDD